MENFIIKESTQVKVFQRQKDKLKLKKILEKYDLANVYEMIDDKIKGEENGGNIYQNSEMKLLQISTDSK